MRRHLFDYRLWRPPFLFYLILSYSQRSLVLDAEKSKACVHQADTDIDAACSQLTTGQMAKAGRGDDDEKDIKSISAIIVDLYQSSFPQPPPSYSQSTLQHTAYSIQHTPPSRKQRAHHPELAKTTQRPTSKAQAHAPSPSSPAFLRHLVASRSSTATGSTDAAVRPHRSQRIAFRRRLGVVRPLQSSCSSSRHRLTFISSCYCPCFCAVTERRPY